MKQHSIVEKFQLLEKVYASPNDFSKEDRDLVFQACKSQGSLALFSSDELGIEPSSLNTMKAQANKVLDNGFVSLDRIRKNVLTKLEKLTAREARPNRGTRAELLLKITEQEQTIQKMNDSITTMTAKLDEIMRFAHSIARDTDQLEKIKRMQHELFIKF
jgi:methyl-accepting chemotaxis protein